MTTERIEEQIEAEAALRREVDEAYLYNAAHRLGRTAINLTPEIEE